MFAQVDSEGRQYQILDEIIDHRKDNTAVPISEGMIQGPNGEMKPKITTQGHEFLCSFKDGSMDWVKLKDLKESNGIEIAKFIVANCLVEEPAFKWWVPKVLQNNRNLLTSGLDSGSSWLDGVNGILMQQEPNSPKQDYWN
jgi:hypothetical protein